MAGNLTRARSRLAVAGALLLTMAALGLGLATTSTVEAAAPKSTVVAGPKVSAGDDPEIQGEDSMATCPSGTHLIGGGYKIFMSFQREVPVNPDPKTVLPPWVVTGAVVTNAPSVRKPNTWAAGAQAYERGVEIQAFALCETNS